MLLSKTIGLFVTIVPIFALSTPLIPRATTVRQTIGFDNVKRIIGAVPAAIFSVDRPLDANGQKVGVAFQRYTYQNLSGELSVFDAASPDFCAATNFRAAVTSTILEGLVNVEFKPVDNLAGNFSVRYPNSPYSSMKVESLYVASGLALGLPGTIKVPSKYLFKCTPADESAPSIFHEASYVVNGRKMTKVIFPDTFTGCRDVEVILKPGLLNPNILSSNLIVGILIDEISLVLTKK